MYRPSLFWILNPEIEPYPHVPQASCEWDDLDCAVDSLSNRFIAGLREACPDITGEVVPVGLAKLELSGVLLRCNGEGKGGVG